MIKPSLIFSLLLSSQTVLAQVMEKTPTEMRADLAKLEKSIEVTKQKMREVQDVMFLPDLYFFLAELYTDKSRYQFNLAKTAHPNTPVNDLDVADAQKSKKQAIEMYQRFIENFPKHENLDKALFFMAHEYRELGNTEEMLKNYGRILKDFPKSKYWEESQLIVADHFFETKKDPAGALSFYQKILDRPANPFTPLALYKAGWCYINLNKFYDALLAYEGVLTFDGKKIAETLPEIYRKTDVRTDALMAMVWPYSEQKKLSPDRANALAYFERLSPNRATYVKVLNRLARRLMMKERTEEAMPVYFKLVDMSQRLDDRIQAIDNLYETFKKSKKTWPLESLPRAISSTLISVRYAEDIKDAEKARIEKNWEIYVRDFATRIQKKAKESKKTPDLEAATDAYEQYLQMFPRSKFANSMMLNQAENLFSQGKYAQAALRYEKLARSSGKKRDLFDSTVQSYAQALKDTDLLSRLETVQAREGFRQIGNYFLKNFPNDKANAMILFNIGRTYYDERNFPQAIQYFQKFIDQYPNHSESTTAGRMILDSFNQREDYDGMVKAGKALIANKKLNNAAFKADVAEIIRQADYRKIQDQVGDPRSREYAKKLLAFASKYQGSSLGDQALYEAFTSLKKKNDPDAFGPGEQLLLKHGDSKYAKAVVSDMGQMALSIADYQRAANYFESFAHKYPKDPQSRELLKSAAQMRELMGNYKEAAANYQDLGMMQDGLRQYVTAQDWSKVTQSLGPRAHDSLKTQYWMGLALYRQGQFGNSQAYLQKITKRKASSFEDKTMVAHSLYLLASMELKEYNTLKLGEGNEAEITKKKSEKLAQLGKLFDQVISYGNGRWTIASLYELGRANAEFAEFIQKASMPAGLSAEQQAQFRQIVQNQSGQFKKKSEGFFTSCLTNAEKFEVFTNFVRGCRSQGSIQVDESTDDSASIKALESYPPEALEVRKKLLADSKNRSLYLRLGQIYLQSKDYAMARLIFSRMTEIFPKDTQAQAYIGVSLIFENNWDGAAENFKAVLAKSPKEPLALYGLAALYKQFEFQGRFQQMAPRLKSVSAPKDYVHPWMTSL